MNAKNYVLYLPDLTGFIHDIDGVLFFVLMATI